MPPPLRARVDGHDKNRVGRSNDGRIEGKYWDVGSRGGLWLGESASAAACERTERENRERPETYRSITPTHSETLTRYGRWRPQNASAQLQAVDLKARECAPSPLHFKVLKRGAFLGRRARQLQRLVIQPYPGMLPPRARNADSTMCGRAVFFKSGPDEWSHLPQGARTQRVAAQERVVCITTSARGARDSLRRATGAILRSHPDREERHDRVPDVA